MKNTHPSLGILLLLMILFAGCGSQPGQEVPDTTTTSVTETTILATTTSTSSTVSTSSTSTTSTTIASAGEKCWDASNKYLYFDIPQMRKFCKCASGNFAWKTYSRAGNYAPAYSYIDYRDTGAWAVRRTPSAYSPLYYVVCSDNRTYWTNQTYYR